MTVPKYYLSIVAVCKNEHSYLPEWLAYHQLAGVDHVFLYDNDSAPPIVIPTQFSEFVEVIPAPGSMDRFFQEALYTRALTEVGPQTIWAAFIDVDEFLFPKLTSTIPEFLYPHEGYAGGIRANWQIFGSNGFKSRPSNLLQMEAFTQRAPRTWDKNRHVKSIVQPNRTTKNHIVHNFDYRHGFEGHDEHCRPSGPPVSVDKIQINHYWLRSRGEYAEKVARSPVAWNRDKTEFDRLDSICNSEFDGSLPARFARRVRALLGMSSK